MQLLFAASGTALRCVTSEPQCRRVLRLDSIGKLFWQFQHKPCKELLKCFEEKVHPEQLIDRVTTPQGCTIAGLNEMEMHGFSSSLIRGIKTSLKQIKG
jgi:pyrroline-5-carboxylate reductase